MSEPFKPAWWLPSPHMQTLWGPMFRHPAPLQRRRERLWLEDGDFLDLDWYGRHAPDTPLVLVLHGLTGSSNSLYVLGLQQALSARGWASVALNWRGCSGEPNLLPRSYHSGVSEDLAETLRHLRAQRPMAPLYAVGYSLGGNVLLKYLGEHGGDSGLQGAVAVSVPFRLDQCADRISQGFSRFYQAHFMREMVAYVKSKQRLFAHQGMADRLTILEKLGPLDDLSSFWEFDARITAPLHGFADVQDYYRRASSHYYLDRIQTQTLIVQAVDDPFVSADCLPQAAQLPACVELELHPGGGHVGFIDGSPRQPGYYLERRIPLWLADHLAAT